MWPGGQRDPQSSRLNPARSMLPAAMGSAAVLTQDQLLCPGENGGSQGLAVNLMDGLDTDHRLNPE